MRPHVRAASAGADERRVGRRRRCTGRREGGRPDQAADAQEVEKVEEEEALAFFLRDEGTRRQEGKECELSGQHSFATAPFIILRRRRQASGRSSRVRAYQPPPRRAQAAAAPQSPCRALETPGAPGRTTQTRPAPQCTALPRASGTSLRRAGEGVSATRKARAARTPARLPAWPTAAL